MEELKIHQILEKEVAVVEALANKCWDYPMEEPEIRRLLEEPKHWCWIASSGKEYVGYLAYTLGDTDMELLDLGVRPSYRGRGFSTRLLMHVAKEANAARVPRVTALVNESYMEALQWLKRFGFRCVLRQPEYFTLHNETYDGYLMTIGVQELCENLYKSLS